MAAAVVVVVVVVAAAAAEATVRKRVVVTTVAESAVGAVECAGLATQPFAWAALLERRRRRAPRWVLTRCVAWRRVQRPLPVRWPVPRNRPTLAPGRGRFLGVVGPLAPAGMFRASAAVWPVPQRLAGFSKDLFQSERASQAERVPASRCQARTPTHAPQRAPPHGLYTPTAHDSLARPNTARHAPCGWGI